MKEKVKKKKDNKTSSSLIIAALACFVLIAVYGIITQLKVSYAFPDALAEIKNVKEVLPDQIAYSPSNVPSTWKKPNNKIIGNIVLEGKTTAEYIIDIFCLQSEKIMPKATDNNGKKITYTKAGSQALIDEGINYIILKAYEDNTATETESNGVKTIALSDDAYYDAQMALWIYQNNNAKEEEKVEDLTDMWTSVQSSDNSHATKIKTYVNGAQEAKNSTAENKIEVVGKTEFNLTTDEKYYETENLKIKITKAVNTELTSLKLKLENDKDVPVHIVDSKGVEITDYSKITADSNFKFRINKDDLPVNTTVNISGEIDCEFNHMGFEAYEAYVEETTTPSTVLQIALIPVTKSTSKSFKIKASISVPDTGFGYSGYIYIIGAIILIVGLTIIYVNTKVQEN